MNNASIPATFAVDISLNGSHFALIETTSELPITINGGLSPGDIPKVTMQLDESRVRYNLAEALRATADRIETGDA